MYNVDNNNNFLMVPGKLYRWINNKNHMTVYNIRFHRFTTKTQIKKENKQRIYLGNTFIFLKEIKIKWNTKHPRKERVGKFFSKIQSVIYIIVR